MTEQTKDRNKLDESAAKLDEGAGKLDEGAGKLHEGAMALHEVAAELSGDAERAQGAQHAETHASAELGSSERGATMLRLTRSQAEQLQRVVRDSGARAIILIKRHPLGALTTLSVAAAFIKLQFAVGLLAGVAGAALLVNQPGEPVRRALANNGRLMLARARAAWQTRRERLPRPAAAT